MLRLSQSTGQKAKNCSVKDYYWAGVLLITNIKIIRTVIFPLFLVGVNILLVNRARSECHGCTAALRLIVQLYTPVLDVPTYAVRCLQDRKDARDPNSER